MYLTKREIQGTHWNKVVRCITQGATKVYTFFPSAGYKLYRDVSCPLQRSHYNEQIINHGKISERAISKRLLKSSASEEVMSPPTQILKSSWQSNSTRMQAVLETRMFLFPRWWDANPLHHVSMITLQPFLPLLTNDSWRTTKHHKIITAEKTSEVLKRRRFFLPFPR